MLTREKEGLDQLPLAAQRRAREPFVPFTFGDLGFGIEPLRQQLELSGRNPAALDAVEEMLQKCRRKMASRLTVGRLMYT